MREGRGVRPAQAAPSQVARHALRACAVALLPVWLCASVVAAEQVVTVLADFEDASVAASVGDVQNVLAADCGTRRVSIPARGTGSLALDIGATARGVSVACELIFREPLRFPDADRIAIFCWINDGAFELAFQLRDARGQLFETTPQAVRAPRRWLHVSADLLESRLRRVRGTGRLAWPIEVQGCRVTTNELGKHTLLLDDLQIEHRVDPRHVVRGRFELDEPTHLYEPGSRVDASVVLENQSRSRPVLVQVTLEWTRPDGSVLDTQRASVRLQPGGSDFRSYRELDFSQTIRESGLYRLVAAVRAPDWPGENVLETTIAITPGNRRLSRGRSTFFGVCSNLLREPELDQALEIGVALDMGVNLLCVNVPWRRVQPRPEAFDFTMLEPVISAISERQMAAMVQITEPPDWAGADPPARVEALTSLVDALAAHFAGRLTQFLIDADSAGGDTLLGALESVRQVHAETSKRREKTVVMGPPVPADQLDAAADVGRFVKSSSSLPVVFATRGDLARSVQTLDQFRQRGAFLWHESHRWLHTAIPAPGDHHDISAEAVLRHSVRTAVAGVGGLLWFDLRDDDNDPQHPERLCGLVRRDFSPKPGLLGYSAAAGQLTGYHCAGEVAGTPDAFESGLFIGAHQQIAVLLPRPDHIQPAVVAPLRASPGDFAAQDFERRPLPVLLSLAPPLVPASSRPMFVLLRLKEPRPEPQLSLSRPWLRVPSVVHWGDDTGFVVEIDAVVPLRRSYLQLKWPKDAPLEASLAATALQAEEGETLRQEIRLLSKAGRRFDEVELTLRVSVEGQVLDVPLLIRSVSDARHATVDRPADDGTSARAQKKGVAAD